MLQLHYVWFIQDCNVYIPDHDDCRPSKTRWHMKKNLLFTIWFVLWKHQLRYLYSSVYFSHSVIILQILYSFSVIEERRWNDHREEILNQQLKLPADTGMFPSNDQFTSLRRGVGGYQTAMSDTFQTHCVFQILYPHISTFEGEKWMQRLDRITAITNHIMMTQSQRTRYQAGKEKCDVPTCPSPLCIYSYVWCGCVYGFSLTNLRPSV